jgi:hypothetical protein
MNTATTVVVVLTIVVVFGLLGWFVMNRRHPEVASTHVTSQDPAADRHGAAALFGDTNDPPRRPRGRG